MKKLWKDKLLLVVMAYLLAVLAIIPLTLVSLRKPTDQQTAAAGTAILSYEPSVSQKNTGETAALDAILNPGTHAVSYVTLDILYDPNKLAVDQNTALQINTTAFPQILEGPLFETGRIRVKVSIGFDPTKAITAPTKVATITFTAIGATNGQEAIVHFGESSYVLSVSPNDNATDNVLSSVLPAQMTISGNPIGGGGISITPVPTFFGGGTPNPTQTPSPTDSAPSPTQNPLTPSPTDSQTPTPTNITPEPTCKPLPPECKDDDDKPTCEKEDDDNDDDDKPRGGFCTDEPVPTFTPDRKPTKQPRACEKQESADIMFVLDTSGSMNGVKIGNTKESAKNFLKLIKNDAKNRFGLITFDKKARKLADLTQNAQSIEQALNSIKLGANTCTKCGIDAADSELNIFGRPNAKKVMILLTDGKANTAGGLLKGKINAEKAALDAVKKSKTQGLTVYTIGVGNDVNHTFLQEIANTTNGSFYFTSKPIEIDAQFDKLYQKMSDDICKPDKTPDYEKQSDLAYGSPNPSVSYSASYSGQTDTTTILMVGLLMLPLLLLVGHLLI